jgi:DNA-binding MarR family transcriptional regulator
MAAKRSVVPTPDVISDPVDWAAHFWEGLGLEGDEQQFLAMTSLLRYQRIVVDAVEQELHDLRLNMTDYLMLMTLELSSSGTRLISSLARNLMVHATTATLATDRLEEKALLYRSPHPTDRRATCVTITEEGRRVANAATIALGRVEFGFVGSNPASVKKLADALKRLRDQAGDTRVAGSTPNSRARASA